MLLLLIAYLIFNLLIKDWVCWLRILFCCWKGLEHNNIMDFFFWTKINLFQYYKNFIMQLKGLSRCKKNNILKGPLHNLHETVQRHLVLWYGFNQVAGACRRKKLQLQLAIIKRTPSLIQKSRTSHGKPHTGNKALLFKFLVGCPSSAYSILNF